MEEYAYSTTKKEKSDEEIERIEREREKSLVEEKYKAERFASEFAKARRESIDEKEKETVSRLSKMIKEDPEVLDQIISTRKIQLYGIGPATKTQTPSLPVAPKSISPIQKEIVYSGDAQKIFQMISPVLKQFMYENAFSESEKILLYKYYILWLLNAPDKVINEVGSILFDNLLRYISSQITSKINEKQNQVNYHMRRHREAVDLFRPNRSLLKSELDAANAKKKEIEDLQELLKIWESSDDINKIKKYLIQEIGKENFDEFVYFIERIFYEPGTGIEYQKGLSQFMKAKKILSKRKFKKKAKTI